MYVTEHILTLVPVDDGLKHRPRAEWSIMYMNCELDDAEIWLKSALQEEPGKEVSSTHWYSTNWATQTPGPCQSSVSVKTSINFSCDLLYVSSSETSSLYDKSYPPLFLFSYYLYFGTFLFHLVSYLHINTIWWSKCKSWLIC